MAFPSRKWVHPGLVIAAAVLIASLYLRTPGSGPSRRQRAMGAPDRTQAKALVALGELVESKCGRVFGSIPEVTRSYYYPFWEPYSLGCSGGHIGYGVVGRARWVKVSPPNGSGLRGFAVRWEERGSLEERNSRLLTAYCAGVKGRLSALTLVRDAFLRVHQSAVDTYARLHRRPCPRAYTRKPLVSPPLRGDLPRDERELQLYTRWLARTEGVQSLRDAWGHAVRLFLDNGHLACVSAGPDGLLGSQDDILVRGPAHSGDEGTWEGPSRTRSQRR